MSASIPTSVEVSSMTLAQLAEAFNALAFAAGVEKVRRFSDREAGVRRLTKVCDLLRARVADAAKDRAAKCVTDIDPGVNRSYVEGKPAARVATDGKASPGLKASAARGAVERAAASAGATRSPSEASASPARKPSVAGRVRELVAAGKTDAEVWAVIQPEFDMPDSKKGYPAWYRADAVRRARGGVTVDRVFTPKPGTFASMIEARPLLPRGTETESVHRRAWADHEYGSALAWMRAWGAAPMTEHSLDRREYWFNRALAFASV